MLISCHFSPGSVISKRMIKRSRLSCFKKWQKMTGLYSPSDALKMMTETPFVVRGAASAADHRPSSSSNSAMGTTTTATATTPNPTVVATATPTAASVPESARNAPTAGAAAAAAAAASRLDHHSNSISISNSNSATTTTSTFTTPTHDLDFMLLSDIVNSGAIRESDMDWDSVRDVDRARARWNALFEEWLDEAQPDDRVLELPIFEIARLLLERKQQAKMAAETVEAVDLPTLKTRDI